MTEVNDEQHELEQEPAEPDLSATDPAPDLPAPPRRVTRHGWWRAWGDRRVRFWLICVAGVSIVVTFITVNRVKAAMGERQLITQGTPVRATLLELERSRRYGYSLSRNDIRQAKLQAKLPDGRDIELEGKLPPGGDGFWRVGQDMDVRVDPNDLSRWTTRTEMAGWGTELVIPLSLLPLILLFAIIAIWQRQRVLNVWRYGWPVHGVVLELRHTAIAPLSRVVRYSIPELHDKRIFTTLIPNKDGVPLVGETILLIALQENAERAVVAKLYL